MNGYISISIRINAAERMQLTDADQFNLPGTSFDQHRGFTKDEISQE
jgi:hypothetical protein